AMEVYNELGRGMEEPIYQEAMALELDERGIPYEREKILHTHYKGQCLKKTYVADFYSQGIIVEFKSVTQITQDHRAQLFNYLRITKLQTGIIINYGEDHFHAERYIYDADTDRYELLTQRNLHKYIEDQ
ncbi:MAG: GxxExxY protein, partial [Bacteroidaceae bacterium]|nr:GxxExxY protein [Bacteroidaceae bacterium]